MDESIPVVEHTATPVVEESAGTESNSSTDVKSGEREDTVMLDQDQTVVSSDAAQVESTASPATSPATETPPVIASVVIIPPAVVVPFISTSASGKTRTWLAKYYAPSSGSGSGRPSVLDLPESYFAPTPSELQAAFAGQVKKREMLIDAPLLTKKLRDQEEEAKGNVKRDRWPQTRIRIRFADRSQLEGVFNSTETLAAIYEFVKFSLVEEHRLVPFVLYQTPPKKEYNKSDPAMKGKSMIDLQFTPSSVFYIRFDLEDLDLSATPPPLIPSLLEAAAELPAPPTFDPSANVESAVGPIKSKVNTLGFGGASGKVTPAWMRGGKSGKK